MKYKNIVKGTFLNRPNRFIANCIVNNEEVLVHVKNTGRCKELLIPDATIFLEKSPSLKRKTPYSLISVLKGDTLINIDSQAPNKVVYEGLMNNKIDLGLGQITNIKAESTYKNSRFDFYVETEKHKILIEVKGVTLEENNIALFPDAPTLRGIKHINELISATNDGYKSFIIFIIQLKGIKYFTPNIKTHKEFADTLIKASNKNVKILAYDCMVSENSLEISEKVKVILN